MKWLILALGVGSNALASILIKLAVQPPRAFPSLERPMEALRNWPFWLALAFYGGTFLLYTAALSRLPLNVAHPVFTGGAVVVVALCSFLLFEEAFSLPTVLGILLVIAGIVLITLRVR